MQLSKKLKAAIFCGAMLFCAGLVTANERVNSPLKHAASTQASTMVKPMTVGVLGDSLSAAYNLKAEQGWVKIIEQQALQIQPNIRFINASISGATTDAGLQALPALLKHQPNIVLLALGANDGLQGKPLPLIRKNLSLLIQQIQQAGAEVVLLGIRIPPNLGKRYTEPFFGQYAELAKTYDLTLFPFLLEGVAGNAKLMMRDGAHPNAEGQKVIANNIWPTIRQVITTHQATP